MRTSDRKTRPVSAVVVALMAIVALVLSGCSAMMSGAAEPAVPVPAFDASATTTSPSPVGEGDASSSSSSPAARDQTTAPAATPWGTSAAVEPNASEAAAPTGIRTETVVLAGGCFWGVQGVYQHVKGVTMAESGYAGGAADTADYETVSTGSTGHAEVVRVTFDPDQVSLAQILQIYFSAVHDPTELDRQGPDTGTQYRSEVFAQNPGQQVVVNAYIAQLTAEAVYAEPIVTKVQVNTDFYPAEAYHQDYLTTHPDSGYIQTYDLPKIKDLQKLFPQLYRDEPVLVSASDN